MIPENNEAREISFYQGKWMVGSVNKGCPISSSAPEAQNATILMVFQLDLQWAPTNALDHYPKAASFLDYTANIKYSKLTGRDTTVNFIVELERGSQSICVSGGGVSMSSEESTKEWLDGAFVQEQRAFLYAFWNVTSICFLLSYTWLLQILRACLF